MHEVPPPAFSDDATSGGHHVDTTGHEKRMPLAGGIRYRIDLSLEVWSGRGDSNPRPQPWQGCALPLSYTRISSNHIGGAGKLQSALAPEAGSLAFSAARPHVRK